MEGKKGALAVLLLALVAMGFLAGHCSAIRPQGGDGLGLTCCGGRCPCRGVCVCHGDDYTQICACRKSLSQPEPDEVLQLLTSGGGI